MPAGVVAAHVCGSARPRVRGWQSMRRWTATDRPKGVCHDTDSVDPTNHAERRRRELAVFRMTSERAIGFSDG